MINYWSIDNHAKDTVGGAHMLNGYNVEFVEDRFGKPNSAIRFSDGYYQVPPGVYFNGDFSVAVWVKINVRIQWASLIDFSYDYFYYHRNNVIITSQPAYKQLTSNLALSIGQWTYLVVTLIENTASIYINGILAAQVFNSEIPTYANRTLNFIGKSCSANDGNLWADLDDLRIYNRALSQSEIYDLIRLTSGYTPLTTTTTKTSTTTTTRPITTTTRPTTTTTRPITTTTRPTTTTTRPTTSTTRSTAIRAP